MWIVRVKVCVPYVVTLILNQSLILELSDVWQGLYLWTDSKKNMLWWDWTMCSNSKTILDSIVNKIGTIHVFHFKKKENIPFTSYNFCISTPIWKLDITICLIPKATFADSLERWKSSVELEVPTLGSRTLTQICQMVYSAIGIRTLKQKQQSDVWPNLSALHMAICPPRLPTQTKCEHCIRLKEIFHHTQFQKSGNVSPYPLSCTSQCLATELAILHWPSKPQNPKHTHVRYPPVITHVD